MGEEHGQVSSAALDRTLQLPALIIARHEAQEGIEPAVQRRGVAAQCDLSEAQRRCRRPRWHTGIDPFWIPLANSAECKPTRCFSAFPSERAAAATAQCSDDGWENHFASSIVNGEISAGDYIVRSLADAGPRVTLDFLLAPDAALAGRMPLQALQAGDRAAVLRLVHGFQGDGFG